MWEEVLGIDGFIKLDDMIHFNGKSSGYSLEIMKEILFFHARIGSAPLPECFCCICYYPFYGSTSCNFAYGKG